MCTPLSVLPPYGLPMHAGFSWQYFREPTGWTRITGKHLGTSERFECFQAAPSWLETGCMETTRGCLARAPDLGAGHSCRHGHRVDHSSSPRAATYSALDIWAPPATASKSPPWPSTCTIATRECQPGPMGCCPVCTAVRGRPPMQESLCTEMLAHPGGDTHLPGVRLAESPLASPHCTPGAAAAAGPGAGEQRMMRLTAPQLGPPLHARCIAAPTLPWGQRVGDLGHPRGRRLPHRGHGRVVHRVACARRSAGSMCGMHVVHGVWVRQRRSAQGQACRGPRALLSTLGEAGHRSAVGTPARD